MRDAKFQNEYHYKRDKRDNAINTMNATNAKIWAQKQKEREKTLRALGKRNVSFGNFKKIYFPAIFILGLLAAGGVYAYQKYFSESPLEMSGNIITVRAGGNFQDALNRAKPGDTIQLQAGATFSGNFTLPKKSGNEFITVRTTANDAQLPPAGTRLDPKKYASVLPKLISPTTEPVISTTDGAHHYRFIGIEFGATKGGVGNIIKIGTTEEKRVEDLPNHLEFDRVYIHGSPTEGQRRGIAANGKFIRIVNSHISDIKRRGDEAQAIAVWGGEGNIEIINNYLEASAENILFGGAGSFLKLVPTDCLVKDNWLNKPLNWREEGWDVKNLFEIKNGRRIKIENNLMTNNWGHAQDGTALLFSTRADNGKQDIIEDIEFMGNIVRGTGNGISVYGPEGSGGHRLTIRNNIFADINGQKWNGAGFFMKSTDWDGLVIENNVIIQTSSITNAYDSPVRGFIFRNNIIFENEYGFKGDGTSSGKPTLDKFFPNGDVSFNAVIGGNASLYKGKNIYPVSLRQIGFVNPEGGDYNLRPDSPLRAKGFQGKNIGVELDIKTVGGK